MKVLALNGSAHANGNTHIALEIVGDILQKQGIEIEILDLVKLNLHPFSFEKIPEDDIKIIADKMIEANGIILASPTYYSNVSSRMQMVIECVGNLVNKGGKNLLKGKIGASIAVARRGGANVVYAALNYFFGIHEMPIVSSTYWNIIIAREPGKIKEDKEGIEILHTLALNMADLLKKVNK
jgi:multimeric flavodoxin WrbA